MSKWGNVNVKVLGRRGVDEQEHMVKVRQNTRSQSRGDENKRGRTLASMMMTTRTSSTIRMVRKVMKMREILGAPMPKTESTIQNDRTS